MPPSPRIAASAESPARRSKNQALSPDPPPSSEYGPSSRPDRLPRRLGNCLAHRPVYCPVYRSCRLDDPRAHSQRESAENPHPPDQFIASTKPGSILSHPIQHIRQPRKINTEEHICF